MTEVHPRILAEYERNWEELRAPQRAYIKDFLDGSFQEEHQEYLEEVMLETPKTWAFEGSKDKVIGSLNGKKTSTVIEALDRQERGEKRLVKPRNDTGHDYERVLDRFLEAMNDYTPDDIVYEVGSKNYRFDEFDEEQLEAAKQAIK